MRRRPSADDEGVLILRRWLGLDREPLSFTPQQEARIRAELEELARVLVRTEAVLRRELERRTRGGRAWGT